MRLHPLLVTSRHQCSISSQSPARGSSSFVLKGSEFEAHVRVDGRARFYLQGLPQFRPNGVLAVGSAAAGVKTSVHGPVTLM